MTDRKKKKTQPPIPTGPFDEMLARFIQTDPKELEDAYESLKREEREVDRYVRERQDSIRRGARRTGSRFRP